MITLKLEQSDILYVRMCQHFAQNDYGIVMVLLTFKLAIDAKWMKLTPETEKWMSDYRRLMTDIYNYSSNVEDKLPDELMHRAMELYKQVEWGL